MTGRSSEAVTFTLPTGARVTAPLDTARKLGWQPPAEKPAPKRTRKK